jgi:hypothetical protein
LADPILMVIALWSIAAIGQSVPEFDLFVGTGWDNLSVILGKADCEYFLFVADELADSLACFKIPKAKGFVPRWTDTVTAV